MYEILVYVKFVCIYIYIFLLALQPIVGLCFTAL